MDFSVIRAKFTYFCSSLLMDACSNKLDKKHISLKTWLAITSGKCQVASDIYIAIM